MEAEFQYWFIVDFRFLNRKLAFPDDERRHGTSLAFVVFRLKRARQCKWMVVFISAAFQHLSWIHFLCWIVPASHFTFRLSLPWTHEPMKPWTHPSAAFSPPTIPIEASQLEFESIGKRREGEEGGRAVDLLPLVALFEWNVAMSPSSYRSQKNRLPNANLASLVSFQLALRCRIVKSFQWSSTRLSLFFFCLMMSSWTTAPLPLSFAFLASLFHDFCNDDDSKKQKIHKKKEQ